MIIATQPPTDAILSETKGRVECIFNNFTNVATNR